MAKVTLINPSSREFLSCAGDRMPLGILYLADALQQRNHNVQVIDFDHTEERYSYEPIYKFKPDFIGVSILTSVLWPQAKKIAEFYPKVKKIAGGYHATAMHNDVEDYFDYVVMGEGEKTLVDIVEGKIRPDSIDGIKPEAKELSIPARNLLDPNLYTLKQDNLKTATLMSSRGCPNACVYCGNHNRVMRYVPVDLVAKDIDNIKAQGYESLYFLDDTFAVSKPRVKEMTEMLKDKKMPYRIVTRANTIDDEVAKMLADSGCIWANLGIESGSDKCLKAVGKNLTCAQNEKAVEILHEYGIKVNGYYIFGLPLEEFSDGMKTIAFAKRLKKKGLTTASFYIMTPFPGTDIWDNPSKYGIEIIDKDYTKYLEAGKEKPVAFHRTKYLERSEIEFLRNFAQEKFND